MVGGAQQADLQGYMRGGGNCTGLPIRMVYVGLDEILGSATNGVFGVFGLSARNDSAGQG